METGRFPICTTSPAICFQFREKGTATWQIVSAGFKLRCSPASATPSSRMGTTTSTWQPLLDGEALLALYRQRGTAEGHMGELMDVLAPALSSTSRARSPDTTDAFAHNEALLLLHLLAYEVMHTGRCVVEKITHTGWSLRRFRERVLKIGMRIVLHAQRATLVIAETAASLWQDLWRALDRLAWNTT
jgi:hypothetical protein